MPDFLSEPQRWVIPAVLLVSVAAVLWTLWRERSKAPSSTRRPNGLAWWRAMSLRQQAEYDNAELDAAELAETGRVRRRYEWAEYSDVRVGAEDSARDTAARMAEAAQRNALFHP